MFSDFYGLENSSQIWTPKYLSYVCTVHMYGVCVYPYTVINTHFVVLSMYLTKLMHGIQRGLYITKIGQEKTVGHAVTQSHLLTAYLASQQQ